MRKQRVSASLTAPSLGAAWTNAAGALCQLDRPLKTTPNGIVAAMLAVLLVSWSFPLVTEAQGQTAYVVVHAHNPEGVEIASIHGMDPDYVQIYDGGNLIGYGAYNAATHNKHMAISPGTHVIRAQFNGMTQEQTLLLNPNETKVLILTFERATQPFNSAWHLEGTGGSIEGHDHDMVANNGKFINMTIWDRGWLIVSASAYFSSGEYDVTYNSSITVSENSVSINISLAGVFVWGGAQLISDGGARVKLCWNVPDGDFESWFVQNPTDPPAPGGYPWIDGYPWTLTPGRSYCEEVEEPITAMVSISSATEPGGGSRSEETIWSPYPLSDVIITSVPYDLTGTGVKDEGQLPQPPPEQQPPVASFRYLPEKPIPGGEIEFNASASYDPDGTIVSYKWDFDDGNTAEATSPVVYHTYKEPNECYEVELTVKDNDDVTDTAKSCVKVKGKEFMITFDDGPIPDSGPIPDHTHSILLQLMNCKVHGEPVRAAFFMVGQADWSYCLFWDREPKGSIKVNPGLARMVRDFRHYVGNHTEHHAWFPRYKQFHFKSMEDFVRKEISDCNSTIEQALGESPPRIFRAPYLQEQDYALAVDAGAGDFKVVGGQIVDSTFPSVERAIVNARDILEAWNEEEPVVFIFHDNRSVTYDHIGEIIKTLQDEGYSLAHFDVTRIPKQTQRGAGRDRQVLSGIAHCPVDLVVTDPQGLTLSKGQSQISDALYEELDTNGDGNLDDFFVVPDARSGEYLVHVIPEPNALPDETYSLEVAVDGETSVLAQDVTIRDVPDEPYSVVVGAKPAAHWKSDEGAGQVAVDSAGENKGTVYGARWVDGRIAGALRFDGLDDYVDCRNAPVLAPEQMTIAFWMYVEGRTSYQYVLGKTKDMGSELDYMFYTGGEGKLLCHFAGDPSKRVIVQSKNELPINQWVHVVAVRDGGTASLYLNGQLESSAAYSFVPKAGNQALRIGSVGSADGWAGFFKGMIDDVRIYDVPLSAEEVTELYEQVSP